jgi:hypothetical protein
LRAPSFDLEAQAGLFQAFEREQSLAFSAAGDRQNANAQNLWLPMHSPQRIAWVNDYRRRPNGRNRW